MGRLTRHLFALLVTAPLSGCFGGCGPETAGVEVYCVEAPAPGDSAPRALFGSSRDDVFRELDDGDRFASEPTEAGGHHFFYAVRLFQPQPGRIIKVTLGGTEPGSGGGAQSPPPNDFVFLDDYVGAEDCESWIELQNLPFQVEDAAGEGQLVFELGTCKAGSCQQGPDGTYQLTEVESTFSVRIAWSAGS